LKDLFKGRTMCDVVSDPVTLAAYQIERRSAPDDVNVRPRIADACPPDARQYLERPSERTLRPQGEFLQLESLNPVPAAYIDPKLKRATSSTRSSSAVSRRRGC
jgi:hypothetical protein